MRATNQTLVGTEYIRMSAEDEATIYVLAAEAESIATAHPGVYAMTKVQLTDEEARKLNESNARVHAQQQWRRQVSWPSGSMRRDAERALSVESTKSS